MEKYGTAPKKFTKAWWEYVWEYYKYHALVVLFVLFFIGSIIHTHLTKVYNDLYITYIGLQSFNEDIEGKLDKILVPALKETTDDEITTQYYVYNVENTGDDQVLTEYEYAVGSKIIVELQAGESYLYIMSRANAENMYLQSTCFEPVGMYSSNIENKETLISKEGYPFAISIKDCPLLKDSGLDTDDLYVAVRKVYKTEKDDKRRILTYENSIEAAKLLTGGV